MMLTYAGRTYSDKSIDATQGTLLLGAFDDSKFGGNLTTIKMVPAETGQQIDNPQIPLSSMSVIIKGKDASSFPATMQSTVAVLDSGVPYISLPNKVFLSVMNAIGGEKQCRI